MGDDNTNKRVKRFGKAKNPLPEASARSAKPFHERGAGRQETYRYGILFPAEGGEYKCVVNDISETGARITLINSGDTSKYAILKMDGRTAPLNTVIAWRNDDVLGLEFIPD